MKIDLKFYALAYVGTVLVVIALQFGMRMMGLAMPGGFSTIAPAMMAALITGQRLAKDTKALSQIWRAVGQMTLVAVVLNIGFTALLLLNPEIRGVLQSLPLFYLAILAAVLILLTAVLNRIFLGLGFRSQRKAIDKKTG